MSFHDGFSSAQVCAGGSSAVPKQRLDVSLAALQRLKGSHTPPTRDDADALLKQFGNATLQAKETSEEGSFECAVCHEDVPADEAQTIKTCRDYFCGTCAHHIVQTSLVQCPVCMGPFGSGDLVSVTAVATTDRESASPDTTAASGSLASGTSPAAEDDAGPKVTALVEAVRALKSDEKLVAFSSFVTVLDAAQTALTGVGIESVVFSGKLSDKKRRSTLAAFGGDAGPKVLLCSLKAGGVGVDFTRANHAYLLDTWWNSAAEEQALARVHRIGQTRPCTCVRIVAKQTVEERILALQKAKSALGQGALARPSAEQGRDTLRRRCLRRGGRVLSVRCARHERA